MLFDKKAFVTGSGSKIAQAIIGDLNNNFHVIKHRLHKHSGFLHGDLSDEETAKNTFKSIDHLNMLICCAGGIRTFNHKRPVPDDCLNIQGYEAQEIFNRNFFSLFYTCKYGVPKIRSGGHLIVIGSAVVGSPRVNGEVGLYSCAKAAVHEYVIHLANQLSSIYVNCIATDGHDLSLIKQSISDLIEDPVHGKIIRLESD